MFANVIRFEGETAVINGYCFMDVPMIREEQERQLAEWKARFPNATVELIELPTKELEAMVAHDREVCPGLGSHCWTLGKRSQGEA